MPWSPLPWTTKRRGWAQGRGELQVSSLNGLQPWPQLSWRSLLDFRLQPLRNGAGRHLHPSSRVSMTSPRTVTTSGGTASPGGSALGRNFGQRDFPCGLRPVWPRPSARDPAPVTSGARWLLPLECRQGLASPLMADPGFETWRYLSGRN